MVEREVAANFDEIWLFVEQKWQPEIPTYFKNVLKVCGYSNGITIASIGDEDIEYMEREVRNGNVTKYFSDLDEKKVLEDCTRSEKDFTFTLGHRKCLMSIVNFLKKHFEAHEPETFRTKDALKVKPCINREKKPFQINQVVARKSSLKVPKVSNTQNRQREFVYENQNEISIPNLKIQQGILICKTLTSLINITPSMYAKHMESINKKISSDLVIIDTKKKTVKKTKKKSVELSLDEFRNDSIIEAIICCPLCTQKITVFLESNETNNFLWDTSNFDWHLESVHLNQADTSEITRKSSVDSPVEESLKKIYNREVNLTITTEAKTLMSEKSMNQSDNIDTNNVQEDEIPREVAEKEPLKKSSINDCNKTITCKETISPVETHGTGDETAGLFIQKQAGYRDLIPNEKLRPLIVCYSDTSVEDEEHQQEQLHSEIATGGIMLNKNVETSQKILNSNSATKTTYPVEDLHKNDQNVGLIIPEPGQYVICSLSVKNCSHWPATTPIMKNFVGQVSLTKERAGNRSDVENIEIQLLIKHKHSNRVFHDPVNVELIQVPRKKIIQILQNPLKNRRGGYVFKDKSILDYEF